MSALSIIPDGALLIRNGRIEDVGTTRRIERLKAAQDAMEVDATGSIVMPAFIDSGTRLVWWEQGFTVAKRGALESSAEPVLAGLARHGTLTAEVETDPGGNAADELRLLRIYASLQDRPATLLPSIYSLDLLETAVRLRLVQSATARIGSEEDVASARALLNAARELAMHTVLVSCGVHCDAAAALVLETGVHAARGLEGTTDRMMRHLADSRTVVYYAPAVRGHMATIRPLIDQGGSVALATEFCRDANRNYNMPYTLSLACEHGGMTAAEAITAATVNAAYATGCARDRGTLEPGKLADLVIFDCLDYSEVVHNGAVNQVARVLRHGRTVYRRGRVGVLD